MEILTLEGGRALKGTMTVSGSKNAALPILIASLLTDEPCMISNVPRLDDIDTVVALLAFLGKRIVQKGSEVEITAGTEIKAEAPYELVRKMRASIVVMGPLLARLGRVRASLPGGCAIGGRPIDIHLDGFKRLGGDVRLEQGYVEVKGTRLIGAKIEMPFASVGATENLMMAATLASGISEIYPAAMEPEIGDLGKCLNTMGAHIRGLGTNRLTIEGVKTLHGVNHQVLPDRIEAGTYMIAAAMTGGEIVLQKAEPEHLRALISKMGEAGCEILEGKGTLTVKAKHSPRPTSIETAIYPGFPTDLQAQWMAYMCLANGKSEILENVFENRFMHVAELQRMGAAIRIKGATATIDGGRPLSGADVMVSDLRAGAALVLAGLAANGRTTIHRVYHLDRGYENLEGKLSALGATIRRSKEE